MSGQATHIFVGGTGGGATDHGALTGLGDDDHTQYALADGTRGAFAPRVAMPSAITEYWEHGLGLLTTGDVAAVPGDIITKWVGRRLGTVLTATSSLVAKLIDGVLTPVAVTDNAYWSLPGAYSVGSSRDVSAYCHVAVAGMNGEGAFFGLGATRVFELLHFQRIDFNAYDGASIQVTALTATASPRTIGVRSGASNIKVFANENELTKTVFASNTLTGGKFGALADGGTPLVARWYGIAIGTLTSDADHADVLEYFQEIKPSASDVAPEFNIAAYGDSQTEGTNSDGKSWAHLIADKNEARLIHVGQSAGYFGVGGSPANKTVNNTQLALEYKADAGRNIIIVAHTNDLDQGVGAGAAHMARVKSWGQTRQGEGWEIAVCKLPNRISPYGAATAYNVEVTAFNALCDSDPWMNYAPNLESINGVTAALNGDGVHWSEAGQVLIYDAISASLNLAPGTGLRRLNQFVSQTAHRVFYTNANGDVTELALGADGTYLRSNGASAAPSFTTPAGGAPEGTAVLSTGETVGKVLQADGDNTCSWVALAGGGNAQTANPLSQFASTTSAQLAGVISDETGSGVLVFATSPTLVTPILGVAAVTSLNKVTITTPATGSTLTIVDGATLTASATATVSGTNTGDQPTILFSNFENGGTYVYHGGTKNNGAWTLYRYDNATVTRTVANIGNNGGTPDLATAWTNRAGLVYA